MLVSLCVTSLPAFGLAERAEVARRAARQIEEYYPQLDDAQAALLDGALDHADERLPSLRARGKTTLQAVSDARQCPPGAPLQEQIARGAIGIAADTAFYAVQREVEALPDTTASTARLDCAVLSST